MGILGEEFNCSSCSQNTCEEKEKKLQKELVKGPKDVELTQSKLQQATDALQLADAEGNTISLSV